MWLARLVEETDRGRYREPPGLADGANKGESGREGNYREAGKEAERTPELDRGCSGLGL